MTNRVALALILLLGLFFLADALWLHLGAPVFLARKFADLVEWLAFWR
jgi:hypothetical protein